jgi:glycogen synthase
MLSEIESDYGRPAAARVIPNGRAFVPAAGVEREPIVFAAGRIWDEAKNIGTLCATARELTWPVCVAGSAHQATSTCEALRHVRHVGRLDAEAMRGWFARASIYALPARYEPFGLSVLEAALSGCALVLGDIPSLRETWDDAARFVAPDDERAVASAIQELIDDERLRERWAVRALARTVRLSVDRMADEYLSAYAGMVVAA